MSIKIAINGFGRIGRNVARALFESDNYKNLELVAINDLGDINATAHLLKYDSVHGRFPGDIHVDDGQLVINGQRITLCADRNPLNLPWSDLGVDVVLECTGAFASREKARVHLEAGAKKVLISAPAGKDVKTIVYGVNEAIISTEDHIISNASCTTNCLAPMVKPLHEAFEIKAGSLVTIHAYTNDQNLTDHQHKDIRRARSATQSIIPTKTGAAAAVGLVLPSLNGRLDGYAVRVPTINVSMVDLTVEFEKDPSVEEINAVMRDASAADKTGVLAYSEEPLVSIDFNHNPASCTFDATQTRKVMNLVKIIGWYDNEWGFSNRMLDTVGAMCK